MEDKRCLKGELDRYGGITIVTEDMEWESDKEFEEKLKRSLKRWKTEKIRGVWLQISIKHASFVGAAAKQGFVFHHTKPDYVMMTNWLSSTEPNLLPPFAGHYIGVGGLVLNDKNQLLVISEKYFDVPHWKLPGGEELSDAVMREVKEETGIQTEFICIICCRHLHHFRFGQSDLYFVCLLRPLTEVINMCPAEITDCKWMDIHEYLKHPHVTVLNKYFAEQCLRITKDKESTGQVIKGKTVHTFAGGMTVYSVHNLKNVRNIPKESL